MRIQPNRSSISSLIVITLLSSQAIALPEQSGGLHGYISMNIQTPPQNYGYGVSYYASSWPLLEKPIANFQIGLPATWTIPDNNDFEQPLCPPGTTARDYWPERGPYYREVFEVMEGGLGFWASTQFLSSIPKFMMNATPDCYTAPMVSSPGWAYGVTPALDPGLMGIAQFSNHILIPPDGLTFTQKTQGELIGVATMALPLNLTQKTGDQSWFVFINSANFAEPIAFYIPDMWARLSKDYPIIKGRGLDSRPALMAGGAMEINTVPFFEGNDKDGIIYSKIPQLQFPIDKNGTTVLMEGIHYYSKRAIYTPFKKALASGQDIPTIFNPAGTWKAPCQSNSLYFTQGEKNIQLTGIDEKVETFTKLENSECVFGLNWKTPQKAMAKFPVYFKQEGDVRAAVGDDDVPDETQLKSQEFTSAKVSGTYEYLARDASVWSHWVSAPIGVKLTDGSIVIYRWYKFVDQPALQHLHLTAEQKNVLQNIIVKLHKSWKVKANFMSPPPTRTALAQLDSALFVTPPAGMEYGYVPIVISQGIWWSGMGAVR